MKPYCGSPTAARNYVEAGRARADDYYLAEGTGIAERYTASPDTGVQRVVPLSGDAYEAWVAGVDPATGVPKGRLRHDDQAVRFVEVTVNGPKSWSLAAELHPDISAAYDAAQARAATQIIGWLAQHATTRVGSRGAQVQVPVTGIEAVTVAHRTSRAGDPHRHLHLQINARVQAEGSWRGLHTVGVRDSIDALNGIGHAAVATDPGFRDALAAHGFTVDDAGEIAQLREFVGPFSARAGQIGRNIKRYDTDWRAANPGREPGPELVRSWDARAWADGRPDKVVPRDGAEMTRRWVEELHALGYRDALRPVAIEASPVGRLDRDAAVGELLARLAGRRSGWNAADVRGEVEQLIARANIVTDATVRTELTEDLTARTVAECVPLLQRDGVPEHVRALSSPHVIEVEADLTARLAARAGTSAADLEPVAVELAAGLDAGQRDVVRVLAGDRHLVVVQGAAGAGKTTTLAAARAEIERSGHRLQVVTPTLKAARVAAEQVGTRTSSAASLAFAHGYRWDGNGVWARLALGEIDPVTGARYVGAKPSAVLNRGDLLLVDEAGMLDQDTARTLLTIADEHGVRVALVGDRHQLAAVGRGGVLDLAARWADPDACLTLDTVHRFTRTEAGADSARATVVDEEYAQLSLAMREATDPGLVFDALVTRDQIRVHDSDTDRVAAIATTASAGAIAKDRAVVVADSNEQVAALNHAIRDARIAAGTVDDSHTSTAAGSTVGVGDRVVTRHNDTALDVANRDSWAVTGVGRDGAITVHGKSGERVLPAGYVREFVELGYASTVHGVQGDTATTAHLVVGEHTSAASAYVGMTRGREANIAHLVADDVEAAREQWVAVFARDRADLGPAHAGQLAEAELARYAEHRPLVVALAELRAAWAGERDSNIRLERTAERRDVLIDVVAVTGERDATVPALKQNRDDADQLAGAARHRLQRLEGTVSLHAEDLATVLQRDWTAQRDPATAAASVVKKGTGRFGRGRGAVADASEQLQQWAVRWRPYLPEMPDTLAEVVGFAARFDNTPARYDTFAAYSDVVAAHAHPELAGARAEVAATARQQDQAEQSWRDAREDFDRQRARLGPHAYHPNPVLALVDAERDLTLSRAEHDTAQQQVSTLLHEPALRSLPPERISAERERWAAERNDANAQRAAREAQRYADTPRDSSRDHENYRRHAPQHSPGIRR